MGAGCAGICTIYHLVLERCTLRRVHNASGGCLGAVPGEVTSETNGKTSKYG